MKTCLTLLAASAAFTTAALADDAPWRDETARQGVAYEGRVQDGKLVVGGWSNDGGQYVSDELYALGFYSRDGRIGIATEGFTGRAPDGVAAWKIRRFISIEVDSKKLFFSTNCGVGQDFSGDGASATDIVFAFAPMEGDPDETLVKAELSAVKVDLNAGTMDPIPVGDVYCVVEQP